MLHAHERVEILCHDEEVREAARGHLAAHGVRENFGLHVVPNDRVWVRDSGPTFVLGDDGRTSLVNWRFNAWAKYSNYERDAQVGAAVERITGLPRDGAGAAGHRRARRARGRRDRDRRRGDAARDRGVPPLIGCRRAIPVSSRAGYEQVFREYLGIRHTIWLGEGCVGDDTHGHIDDVARFTAPGVIVLAYEEDPADDENHRRSVDNLERLRARRRRDGALESSRFPSRVRSRCKASGFRRATRTSTSRMAS